MLMSVMTITAQTALKKVYNENIDPMEQIDKALVKAKAEGKYVVCQVGGNWCPWCLRTARCCTHKTQVFLKKKRATAKRRCCDSSTTGLRQL